jgi:hypothetical protein
MGVDIIERFFFFVQVMKNFDLDKVFEYVGKVAGVVAVTIAKHKGSR